MTEREEIEDVISRLGLYIDSKDWAKLVEVLDEEVELDYTSLFGGLVEKIKSSEVIARWKSLLTPLKATQHVITNILVTMEKNDSARSTANVRAVHVRPNNLGDALWTVGGRYDFVLNKKNGYWRISAIKLTTLWTTGNPQILNVLDSTLTSSE